MKGGEEEPDHHPVERVMVDVSRAAQSAANGAAILAALSPWGFLSGVVRRGLARRTYLGLAQRGGYLAFRAYRKAHRRDTSGSNPPAHPIVVAAQATLDKTHAAVSHFERHARKPIPGALLATGEVIGMVVVFGAAPTALGVVAAYLVHHTIDEHFHARKHRAKARALGKAKSKAQLDTGDLRAR
jgi:hypothetical protein